MTFGASVRRAQIITTYGVGSIVPVGDEALMVAGIDTWGITSPDIHEPRLERHLGVHGFVLPPAGENGHDIPAVRFPEIYSCPGCNRLDRHGFFTREGNKCPDCKVALIPSRFVIACGRGHIDDFPYWEWVHTGQQWPTDAKHKLTIKARGASAGLRDIAVRCSCGVPERTMQGAFGKETVREVIGHCRGRRPWLGGAEPCTETPRTLQRGASNIYFPIVQSAISIPPWSEGAYRALNKGWKYLKAAPDDALAPMIDTLGLARNGEYTVEQLVEAVRRRKQQENGIGLPAPDEAVLRQEEYEALVQGKPELSKDQEFVCVPAEMAELRPWLERVMLVTRLREVRALTAFTRLLPPSPGDGSERQAPLSAEPIGWLPAIEVQGEGVFLQLDTAHLRAWEAQANTLHRAGRIDLNYRMKFAAVDAEPHRTITPRLLLLHTLAHVLIGEWALAAGYPAASLRERLYVSEHAAGLLIYTATSDAAGSLGGVVDQAKGTRLAGALRGAIRRAAWCSADPLCIEADAAGADALNLAACHSCVLLPEVSCEESNVLLDRAMLVGTPDDAGLGFFSDMLERA